MHLFTKKKTYIITLECVKLMPTQMAENLPDYGFHILDIHYQIYNF